MQRRSQRAQKQKNVRQKPRKQRMSLRPVSTGFPPRMRVKLVYEELFMITPGLSYGSYVFRGNSLFDPNHTSTGHQPRFYDQYTAVYGKYKVYSSSLVLDIINTAGGEGSGAIVAVTPNTEIITFTSWPESSELPRARVSEIIPISSIRAERVTHNATTSSICGLTKGQVQDDDYSAATGSNPVQIWYWNINAVAVNEAVDVTVQCRIRLTFEALMYDRLDVTTS